ncbi:NADH dehydrogenase ubiquinone Fe-S protein 4 [Rhizobium mesoamericanum]|uniref:NADH dehydrogenase ubiquinone Fe-S protein 4 n=1 Tax=Rhizobium mesoamericanum TaxID=1079800 RepID=UPI0009DC214F
MDNISETYSTGTTPNSGLRPPNDNRREALFLERSPFPEDAVARIFKPSRSVTTTGAARTRAWHLVFEVRSPPFIEPLMGYTGSADTLTQLKLEFPTLQSAVRYAESQGLAYVLQRQPSRSARQPIQRADRPSEWPSHSGRTPERLGLVAPACTQHRTRHVPTVKINGATP